MPSLFRFVLIVAILAGVAYGGMWALATFVPPHQREMMQTVPPGRLNRDLHDGKASAVLPR